MALPEEGAPAIGTRVLVVAATDGKSKNRVRLRKARLFSDRRDISTDLMSPTGRAELNFLGEFECLDYRIVGLGGLGLSNI